MRPRYFFFDELRTLTKLRSDTTIKLNIMSTNNDSCHHQAIIIGQDNYVSDKGKLNASLPIPNCISACELSLTIIY